MKRVVVFSRTNTKEHEVVHRAIVSTFRGFGRALQQAKKLGRCSAADLEAFDEAGNTVWASHFPK